MGRVFKWFVVLAIAAGCALLGLVLPGVALSDYTTAEVFTLGGLAGAPIVLVVLAISSIVPAEREKTASKARTYMPLLFVALALGSIVTCGTVSPMSEGPEDEIMARMQACDLARDSVGEGFRRRLVGVQTSSSNKNRRPRWTTFEMLVEGPRAAGEIDVVASGIIDAEGTRHDKPIVLLRADLSVAGKTIDLMRCGEVDPTPIEPRTFDGTVREAKAASVVVGDACTIASGSGSNPHNCRFVIRCGQETLYGKTEDYGFAVCGLVKTESGSALAAKNALDSTKLEGIPMRSVEPVLEFDERERRATLQDAAQSSYVVITW